MTTETRAATVPLSVEVALPAAGTMGHTDDWFRDPIIATRVQYRAHLGRHAHTGEPITVVSVTAFSRTGRNKSWMDPRHFVATGLDASTPPAWVPDAPAWFWDAVDDMAATTVREPVAP
jgi:hypothetical protein